MIYLNTRFIDSTLAKSYLAHEFTHLIAFNQKDRLRGVTDDVWLNEARADYSSTVMGYDSPFSGSNFDQRVMSFSADSSKSLVDWADKPANYGTAHLFMQYLVDQYGIKILADSMNSNTIGIASIDYALQKNGFNIGFGQVYQNWIIALLANNCRLGGQYCYKLADLDGFGVAPRINYLPNSDQVSLSVMYDTDYFSGNWQKIVGGNGDLSLDFSSDIKAKFAVPYLLCYVGGSECKVGDLAVDGAGAASLKLPDFGRQYSSLTLMPFASGKTTGFGNFTGNALSYSFKIAVSPKATNNTSQNNASVTVDPKIQALMNQISALKQQITQLQALLAARISSVPAAAAPTPVSVPPGGYSCKSITADLYFGVENYKQVICLQQLLKAQGESIYSEGQVTGSYSLATQAAVVRFQEKYAADILAPLGLKKGTGYVSSATRNKLNKLLAQ
jgi:peptidoglycan hydrolase-like protein with peptidoglycan-binding domain